MLLHHRIAAGWVQAKLRRRGTTKPPVGRTTLSLTGLLFIGCLILAATPLHAQGPATRTKEGFAVPQPGRVFDFPRDHGSHPEFRIEWWYVTGHLFAGDGARFGFQATFFRRALDLTSEPKGTGAFGNGEIFLAHMTVLDAATGRFLHEERINRDGWDASAATDRLSLTNGNWSLYMDHAAEGVMQLVGSVHGDAVFELALTPEKPLVIFGKDGVSRKGADPTAASHYLTFPRLQTLGTLRLDGRSIAVSGRAWMDHEISSSQLATDQAGWDWCSIHMEDGWDLMAYRMRRTDGSTDSYSTIAWISPEGIVTHHDVSTFSWEPLETWTSPETSASYPIRYRLRLPSRIPRGDVEILEVRPVAKNQELTGSLGGIAYWEGAGDVLDAQGKVVGRCFTELTGYAGSLEGKM